MASLPGTVFSGKAIGDFSASNTIASITGQTVDMRQGRTLWLAFQALGTTASTTETVIACSSGSLAAGKGWWVSRAGTASGAAASKFYFLVGGNKIALIPTAPAYNGITVLCIVWQAGGGVYYAFNGGPLALVTTITTTAVDSTCTTRIGTTDASFGGVPLTSGRAIAAAVWSREASSAEARAGTYSTGTRYALPASVTGDAACIFDFNAARDWDGAASSITTLGSSPVSLAVSGSPALYTVAERRVVGPFSDSHLAVARTDANGHAYTERATYARARITTDALAVGVEIDSTVYGTNNAAAQVGMYVGGAWSAEYSAAQGATPYLVEAQPGAGAGKSVDVWDGPELLTGWVRPRLGTRVLALRLPVYLADGTTAANSATVAPTAPAHRVVLVGDSILTGFWASTITRYCVTALMRQAGYDVTCLSRGSESVYNLSVTEGASVSAAEIAAECDGTSSNTIVWALETNDYGRAMQTAANYGTAKAALLDAVHALVPAAAHLVLTALPRVSPSVETANGVGSTTQDYRDQNHVIAATRPWITVIDGTGIGLVSGDYYSDGLHLLSSGHAKLKTAIVGGLGF